MIQALVTGGSLHGVLARSTKVGHEGNHNDAVKSPQPVEMISCIIDGGAPACLSAVAPDHCA